MGGDTARLMPLCGVSEILAAFAETKPRFDKAIFFPACRSSYSHPLPLFPSLWYAFGLLWSLTREFVFGRDQISSGLLITPKSTPLVVYDSILFG